MELGSLNCYRLETKDESKGSYSFNTCAKKSGPADQWKIKNYKIYKIKKTVEPIGWLFNYLF